MRLPPSRRSALIAAAVAASAAGASQDARTTLAPDLTARVEAAVHAFASGSRVTGYPGNARAASYIEESLRRSGCVDIRREQYGVGVPVEAGSRLVLSDSDEVIPIFGLWPNHVRTTSTPADGTKLPLVYGERGEYARLRGTSAGGQSRAHGIQHLGPLDAGSPVRCPRFHLHRAGRHRLPADPRQVHQRPLGHPPVLDRPRERPEAPPPSGRRRPDFRRYPQPHGLA